LFDLERFINTINTSICYSLHICIEEIQGLNIFCSSLASYNFSNWSLSFVVPFQVLESKVLLSIVKGSIKVHHPVQISLSVMATKEAITNFIFQFNSISYGIASGLLHISCASPFPLFPCSIRFIMVQFLQLWMKQDTDSLEAWAFKAYLQFDLTLLNFLAYLQVSKSVFNPLCFLVFCISGFSYKLYKWSRK
jgi:hypothetical protein